MHRAHHAYSDAEKDPHAPHRFGDVFSMMLGAKHTYHALVHEPTLPEPRFRGYVPPWRPAFALLSPVHFLMGMIHRANHGASKCRNLSRFRPLLPSRPARFSV